MKNILFTIALLLVVSFVSHAQCNSELHTVCVDKITGTTYLKDFKVRLSEASKGQKRPMAIFNISLSNGQHYRFTSCNDSEKESESIVQIYEGTNLVGSNQHLKTGKIYPAFDFLCSKTGVYKVYISYTDGKEGCSVTLLSLVKD